MSLVGDGLHNLVDGMIIAAAYSADPGLGVVTTGAVLLHEVPQEVGEFGVLVRGGLSVGRALLLNFLSASTALVGAVAVLVVGGGPGPLVTALVPLTAGHFIYIAAADLVPELHHEHDPREAVGHAAVLVLGVGVMFALRLMGG
jgi:zinc and cadmium transporter